MKQHIAVLAVSLVFSSLAAADVHLPVVANADRQVGGVEIVLFEKGVFHDLGTAEDVPLTTAPDGRPRVATKESKESGQYREELTKPLPAGTVTTPAKLAAKVGERTVLVLADGATKVGDLVPQLDAAFAKSKACWALGVRGGGIAIAPCHAAAPDKDAVELVVTMKGGKGKIELTRVKETQDVASVDALIVALKDKKASSFFVDRTDLTLKTDSPTIGDLVALVARIHDVGFIAAKVVR